MVEIYIKKDVIKWSELCSMADQNIDRIFISYGARRWITRLAMNDRLVDNTWHINLEGDTPLFTIRDFGGTRSATAEEFIAYLGDKYPADLEWSLFHPEIFSGSLDVENDCDE